MPARPFYLSHFVAVTPLLFASVALAEPLSVAIGESVVIDTDRVADGVSLNEGTIDLSPAVTLSTEGRFTNAETGVIGSGESTLQNSWFFTNVGEIDMSSGVVQNTAGGVFDNVGAIAVRRIENSGIFNNEALHSFEFEELVNEGEFNQRGPMRIVAEGRFENAGVFNVTHDGAVSSVAVFGEFVSLPSATVNFGGYMLMHEALFDTAGSFVNAHDGSIDILRGALHNSGRFDNRGSLFGFSGSELVNEAGGLFNNYGSYHHLERLVNDGTFYNQPNSELALQSLVNNGTFSQRNPDGQYRGAVIGNIDNRGRLEIYADTRLVGELVNQGETFITLNPLEYRTRAVHVQVDDVVRNEGFIIVGFATTVAGDGAIVQQDGELEVFGTVDLSRVSVFGGSLSGNDGIVIAEEVYIGSQGVLDPDPNVSNREVGTLTFEAEVFDIAGTVLIDIEDEQSFDRVLAGTVSFEEGASVVFSAMDAFGLMPGQELEFLVATEILGLEYLAFDFSALSNDFSYSVSRSIGGLSLAVSEIPVPASVWLMLSALIGLRVAARHRSK